MPSVSKLQRRFFAIAAKDPDFAARVHLDPKVAKEWHEKDKKAQAEGEQKHLPEKAGAKK